MALRGPAKVLKLVETERPVLAIDEDEIEVDLPQNVDHPRRGKGKVVAICLAAIAHSGFDSVGLVHCTSPFDIFNWQSLSVHVFPELSSSYWSLSIARWPNAPH